MLRKVLMQAINRISTALVLSVFVGMSLTGCNLFSSGSEPNTVQHDGDKLSMNLDLPKALKNISGLSANVSIDGNTPIALTVNPDDSVSGTISNVAVGSHQLTITYFILESGTQVNLAVAIMDVNVTANSTSQATVADSDLDRDFDDDGDGYTNLAEINIGTSALDPLDVPEGESTLYAVSNGSSDETTSTSYIIKHSVGVSVSGTSQSTNYINVSGFGDL